VQPHHLERAEIRSVKENLLRLRGSRERKTKRLTEEKTWSLRFSHGVKALCPAMSKVIEHSCVTCRISGFCKFKKAKAPQLFKELEQFDRAKLIDMLMYCMKVTPERPVLEIQQGAMELSVDENAARPPHEPEQMNSTSQLPSQRVAAQHSVILMKNLAYSPLTLTPTPSTVVGDFERRFNVDRMAEILDCFHYAQWPLRDCSKFLDIGCGAGGFLLSVLIKTDCSSVIGIEFQDCLATRAQEDLREFDVVSSRHRAKKKYCVLVADAIDHLLELRDATHVLFFLGPCPESCRLARIIASNLSWLRDVKPKTIISSHKLWLFNNELSPIILPHESPSLCDVLDINGCPNTLHICDFQPRGTGNYHLVEIAESHGRGLGLFALEDLEPNQFVLSIQFDYLTKQDLVQMNEEERLYTKRYLIEIKQPQDMQGDDDACYILPLNAARFLNGDRNKSNTVILPHKDGWSVKVGAKAIRKGQELLLDYDHTEQCQCRNNYISY
jgi:hypothetical protein